MPDDAKVQFVELPHDGGVDTRTAPERVAAPKQLVLEDASLAEPGAVKVRRAFSLHNDDTTDGATQGTLDGLRALMTDGDMLVGVGALDSRAFILEQASARWVVADRCGSFPVTRRRDIYSTVDTQYASLARVTGWLCLYMKWANASSNRERAVIYSERDMTLRRDGWLNADPDSPLRLVALADRYFMAFWVDGTDLKASVYDTTTPTVDWTSPVNLATTHATALTIDAWSRPGDANAYVAYSTAAPAIGVLRVQVAAGIPAVQASASHGGEAATGGGVSIAGDADLGHSNLVVAWCNSTNGVSARTIATPALGAVAGPSVVDATRTVVSEIAILTYVQAATSVATIAYGYFTSLSFQESAFTVFMRYNVATAAVVGTPAQDRVSGCYLYQKPWRCRGADIFGLGRAQALEHTLYLFADQRWSVTAPMTAAAGQRISPIGRMLPHTAYPLDLNVASRVMAAVRGATSDQWYALGVEPSEGDLDTGDAVYPRGHVALFEVDFRGDHTHRHTVVGDLLCVPGSFPRYCERDMLANGNVERPRGFSSFVPFHSPVIDSLTPSNGAGSLDVSCVYSYRFTFEYINQAGQRCQSIPSLPYNVTMGVADDTVTVALNVNRSQGPLGVGSALGILQHPALRIVVWRTEGNSPDALYYRVALIFATATSFVDTFSDAVITTHEVLYASQGELANYAAPPALALVPWKDRLFALNSETYELWHSKSFIAGEMPGFNPALVVETDVWRGRPVYASSLGDNLIVWWADAIGVVYGDPAGDAGGVPGTLQRPTLIARGTGLVERASLVETPIGLFFRARRGLYVLGTDLSLRFIGADVQAFVPPGLHANDDGESDVVGGCYVEELDEVHIAQAGGRVLVYDLLRDQWHVHRLGEASSEVPPLAVPIIASYVLHNDVPTVCWEEEFKNDSGIVWYADPEGTIDPASTSRPRLYQQTAWIKLAGLLGRERVRRVWFMGTFPVGTTLQIDYDFDPNALPIDLKENFGDGTPLQQVEATLQRQDAHAVRFTLIGHERLALLRVEGEVEKGTYQRTLTRV